MLLWALNVPDVQLCSESANALPNYLEVNSYFVSLNPQIDIEGNSVRWSLNEFSIHPLLKSSWDQRDVPAYFINLVTFQQWQQRTLSEIIPNKKNPHRFEEQGSNFTT